jgi:hypothetical protein
LGTISPAIHRLLGSINAHAEVCGGPAARQTSHVTT